MEICGTKGHVERTAISCENSRCAWSRPISRSRATKSLFGTGPPSCSIHPSCTPWRACSRTMNGPGSTASRSPAIDATSPPRMHCCGTRCHATADDPRRSGNLKRTGTANRPWWLSNPAHRLWYSTCRTRRGSSHAPWHAEHASASTSSVSGCVSTLGNQSARAFTSSSTAVVYRSSARVNGLRRSMGVAAAGGVVARIVPGPHDAHRQDSHWPMRYDTGRPSSVIRLRISQPRTTSLPCPAGLRARRPSPMMDL